MAPSPPESEDAVARYLAGHLAAEEREAFERSLPENRELREQTELDLKLSEGLARLRERGELDALLRERAPSRLPLYAAAAAVALISLLGLPWFYLSASRPSLLALSPQQFASAQHPSPTIIGSHVLARTRGSVTSIELQGAGVVELRVLPSLLSSTVSYRAQLMAENDVPRGRTLGELAAAHANADGYVTLYLDAAKLAPGDYEVLLSPSVAGGADSKPERFPIRVR